MSDKLNSRLPYNVPSAPRPSACRRSLCCGNADLPYKNSCFCLLKSFSFFLLQYQFVCNSLVTVLKINSSTMRKALLFKHFSHNYVAAVGVYSEAFSAK